MLPFSYIDQALLALVFCVSILFGADLRIPKSQEWFLTFFYMETPFRCALDNKKGTLLADFKANGKPVGCALNYLEYNSIQGKLPTIDEYPLMLCCGQNARRVYAIAEESEGLLIPKGSGK
jgi:hypothetical protein